MGVKCLAQEHNTSDPGRPGLELGPLDPESGALTIRPPRLPLEAHWVRNFKTLLTREILVLTSAYTSPSSVLPFIRREPNEERRMSPSQWREMSIETSFHLNLA